MNGLQVDLDEIKFNLRRVADLDGLAALPGFEHAEPGLVDDLLAEAARFAEEVIAPLNRSGDLAGARRHDDGRVATPPGFADAYSAYVAAGWGAVTADPEYGGGGFPHLLGAAIEEMITSASMAWSLCPLLTQGAVALLSAFGTPKQKALYLPKLVSGEWTGTMNLTEPEAGSDLGAVATRAEPQPDGAYRLVGTKIFITYGEHDLAPNIVHMVLARTPGAPPGTKGLSCFIVPKHLPDAAGQPGARNDVRCVSVEHKLGIHASPTCVMSYGDDGGAVGYLIGDENDGMRYMFKMMNLARLSVGLEGLAIAERSYQQALAYARQRRQGRAPGADGPSPSLIVEHPDVARMLLDMRSGICAMRGLAYRNAEALDRAGREPDPAARQAAQERAALLTPLTKAWATDTGCELAGVGLQIHGGMGFVEETGAAQHYRDARIAPIYEGTNGIQAIDLVARKLAIRDGGAAADLLSDAAATVEALAAAGPRAGLDPVRRHLREAVSAAAKATRWLLASAPEARLAGAAPYLEMLAVTVAGAALADGALAARGSAASRSAAAADRAGRAAPTDAGADAADRALLARFFASNRLARVPGRLAAVTEPGPDLAAATKGMLTG